MNLSIHLNMLSISISKLKSINKPKTNGLSTERKKVEKKKLICLF